MRPDLATYTVILWVYVYKFQKASIFTSFDTSPNAIFSLGLATNGAITITGKSTAKGLYALGWNMISAEITFGSNEKYNVRT